jgi:uncharacterized repeat protein (TIGR01451 family)
VTKRGWTLLLAGMMVASIAMGVGAPAASANVPYRDIYSDGPLTDIFVGNELSCQVAHTGDSYYELYPPTVAPGDCGTFLSIGPAGHPTLYAPNYDAHDLTAIGIDSTPFTPDTQSVVTGSGTAVDPYKVVTNVAAGSSGLTLTETDSYVAGTEAYQTDVTITNSTASTRTGILYRAGDCFLQGSNSGTGISDPDSSSVGCQAASGRIEEWVPVTSGADYYESFYGSVWNQIGEQQPFPNTCDCDTSEDNGAGVSWNTTIPAGSSVTYSQITAFSPQGSLPLTMTKTADDAGVAPGGGDGYTITINNPNDGSATLSSIVDDLPAGFSYVDGSSTGLTTSDPGVAGQELTWSGSFVVPGTESASLHFDVTAASSAGNYFNSASGTASGFSVAPTGPTAEVTVTGGEGADVGISMAPQPSTVSPGATVLFHSDVVNNGPEDATNVNVGDDISSNGAIVSASASQGECSIDGQHVSCGLGGLSSGGDATVDVQVKTPGQPASVSSDGTVSAFQPDPNPDNNQASASTEPCTDCTGGFVSGGGRVTGPPIGGDVTQSASFQAPSSVTGQITSETVSQSPCTEPPDFETYGEVFLVDAPAASGRQVYTDRYKMVTSVDTTVGVPPHEPLKHITLLRGCIELPRCLSTKRTRSSIPSGFEGCIFKVHRDMRTKIVTISELDTGNDPPIRGGG